MNKKILLIINNVIPVVIFNIIFFITRGIDNQASVWLSYIFIHIAYGAFVFSPLLNDQSKQNHGSLFTNTIISLTYCIVQFIVGSIFIILSLESINICLYVQLPLLGIYIILIICNILFNQKSQSNEIQRGQEINFINECNLKLSLIISKSNDKSIISQLTKAKELIEASPSKSYPEVKEIETEVLKIIDELDSAEIDNIESIIKKLIIAVNKRNATIKTLH